MELLGPHEQPQLQLIPCGPPVASVSGISHPPFPPAFNLFLNYSLANSDWMEIFRNLAISVLDHVFLSRFEPPVLNSDVYPLLDPDPDPPLTMDLYPSSSIDSLEKESGYFLQSSSKKESGGIGKDEGTLGQSRERKSFISKAKTKARKDLLEGKQQSIERVLRAVRTPKKGHR